jgi:hypothetical protein
MFHRAIGVGDYFQRLARMWCPQARRLRPSVLRGGVAPGDRRHYGTTRSKERPGGTGVNVCLSGPALTPVKCPIDRLRKFPSRLTNPA